MIASSIKRVIFLLYFWPLIFCQCNNANRKPAKVWVSREKGKYILYRNGAPFLIKGGAGFTHMARLKAIGGNTIRTWDTTHLGAILDEAAANNLAVIAGLYVPESKYLDYFYRDTQKVQQQYHALRKVIQRYRSHPALLMWCVGNEVDFPYKAKYAPFYNAYNRLLDMIHTEDPDHPVTTAIINYQFRNIMNIRTKVSGLDIISFNIFGSIKDLQRKLNRYSWLWNGPFVITEWGIYSPQEAQCTAWGVPLEPASTTKARQYRKLYTKQLPIDNPRFLGALTFYWGQKEEVTPTWYSILDESGAATAMAAEMQALWTDSLPAHVPPALEYMLVNGKGGGDNIIMEPGTLQTASLKIDTPPAGSWRIVWKVLDEDFNPDNTRRPPEHLVSITPRNNSRITFYAPNKEGPYRLYAWLYDNHGNVSTANTPFYVVEKENKKMGTSFPTGKN
jgi:hypothetical protein